MKNRISQIIESEKITRAAFAKRVGVSAPFITQLCNGDANPSARTITDICREFNIRREWLETGEGTMKLPEIDTDLAIINDLLSGDSDEVVRFVLRFMRTYRELTPDRQKVMQDFLATLLNQK